MKYFSQGILLILG